LIIKVSHNRKSQFKRKRQSQAYKTAQIILLPVYHKVLCLFRTEPFTCELIVKKT